MKLKAAAEGCPAQKPTMTTTTTPVPSSPPPASERPTASWRKPHRVTIDGGDLIADLCQESVYPILEAADGRALHELSDAYTDEAVCRFTTHWGFLYERIVGGCRLDRFPLALFRLHRQYFLALVRLCETVRTRPQDREAITAALRALKTSRAERAAYLYPNADATREAARQVLQPIGGAEGSTLDETLTSSERALADQGVPTMELVTARSERRKLDLSEWAARTVASELSAVPPSRLVPVWRATGKGRQGYWEFEDVPIVISLEQILRWSVRSRFRVLHHYVCEGCGREAIDDRADTRFCSEACGTRVRVARWRAQRRVAKKRRAATRKAARRPGRSTRSTKRRGRSA